MSFTDISWLFVFLSLLGNVFVIKKNVMGQWLWAISNLCWIAYFSYMGIYSSAFLFTVYFGMCVWGIIAWSKESKTQPAKS